MSYISDWMIYYMPESSQSKSCVSMGRQLVGICGAGAPAGVYIWGWNDWEDTGSFTGAAAGGYTRGLDV